MHIFSTGIHVLVLASTSVSIYILRSSDTRADPLSAAANCHYELAQATGMVEHYNEAQSVLEEREKDLRKNKMHRDLAVSVRER
jgi:hypothetical protein